MAYRQAMKRTLSTIIAIVGLGLVGCSGGETDATEEAATETTPEAAATPAAATTPDTDLKIGETYKGELLSATVQKIRPDVNSDPTGKQALNHQRWSGALVKVCASDDAEPEKFGWNPWTMGDGGGGVYESLWQYTGLQFPTPTYPNGRELGPGDCFRGWLVFKTGAGMTPANVSYASPALPETVTWAVP